MSRNFLNDFLDHLIPKEKQVTLCSDEEFNKKVAERVAKALEDQKDHDEYLEYAKQFPKTIVTEVTKGENPAWEVGNWLIIKGMVYEVLGGVSITTENAGNEYWYINNPQARKTGWVQSAQVKIKLRTVPYGGQKPIEGWYTLFNQGYYLSRGGYSMQGQTYVQIPEYTILERTPPKGVELDDHS